MTLAFIITDTLFIQPRAAPVSVVSSSGKHIAEFEVGGGTEGEDIYWLASNVLCRGDRAISPCYKASTGKYLFDVDGWHIVSATGLRHQSPSFSPDNRWVIVDHSIFKQETLSGESAFLGAYVLYDIQTTRDYPLPPTDYNLLVFTSWAEDNSAVYLISRPKHPSTMPARDIPFGLLSFNPQTQQFNLLFEQAVSVSWNLDKIWALVVFPSRNPDGTLGLSAGVWQVGTEFMPARVPFSEAMIYADPGWDDYFNRSSFGRPAWSHDGRRVVLGDAEGRLTLMDVDGTVQLLAVDESGASRLDVRLRWSPDDRQIWVQYGTRVWVVTPP